MSRLQRDRFRTKLGKLLSRADDEALVQMVWAVDALQTDRVHAATGHLEFPPEAATTDMGSKYKIHPWELETLVTQSLLTPKLPKMDGRNRRLDCTRFDAVVEAVNTLRSLEGAEAAIFLKRVNVLLEMHRIGQRQFPWQRGWLDVVVFYRSASIYGGQQCADYFRRSFGISLNDFSLIGFALYAALRQSPWVRRSFTAPQLRITQATTESALRLFCLPIANARVKAARTIDLLRSHGPSPTAYQPSSLRRFPMIAFGESDERLRAPLIDLLLQRITSGIYYDLVGGDAGLRNEASSAFEEYSARFIAAMLPDGSVSRTREYRVRGNQVESPDVFLRRADGTLIAAIECKATKLTYAAQFADDPAEEAKVGYEQLAKGAFQVWRYFAHVRRGYIVDQLDPVPCGVVLTLDNWLTMSRELKADVLASANAMADRDHDIDARDRRHVVFCAIQDLESALASTDGQGLQRALAAMADEKFAGWVLPSVVQELGAALEQRKKFPFDLAEALPWWEALNQIEGRGEG